MLSKKQSDAIKDLEIDKTISLALMSSFIILTFQYLVLLAFNLLETSAALLVQTGSKIIVGVIFLLALPYVLKRKLIFLIMIYGLALIVFGYNALFFPENQEYLIELIFPFFFMALPSFIYVLSLRDFEVFKKVVEKAAILIFILGTVLGIMLFTGFANAGVYSMSLSYYMLLPALISLGWIFDRINLISIIFFLISLIIIVALGSRGALLCIAVYTLLRVISPYQRFTPGKIMTYAILLFGLILSILNIKRILIYVNDLFVSYGIQSRTIKLLLEDEISLSGRDSIVELVMTEISHSPILGIGLSGDTRVLGHSYVHNFFVEVVANYGIPLGIVLISLLLLLIVVTLIKSKHYNFIILWVSMGFVHLMVSSSYITDIKFWIFLGVLVAAFNQLTVTKNTLNVQEEK